MGLVVYSQQLPDKVLLAKALQATVPQQLPSQRKSVHATRNWTLKLCSQVQLVESPRQQGAVEVSDVMADNKGSTEHLKEGDEGDHDLSEGVGDDEATI